MTKKLRVVFMGTPEFAVASLNAIVHSGHDVVGVITVPDKPAGRGKELQCSSIKKYAIEKGLKLLQPERLKDETFIQELADLSADVQVVVAFRMLPEIVWNMPKYGTFNLHASLLPQYRGAAPINHAIINGETKTGITTFFLDHKIDTGQIIYREEIDILPEDNIGSLHDKMMQKGANLVVKTLEAIANNSLNTQSQSDFIKPDTIIYEAPKIFKEHCKINWEKSCISIHNLVRGLSPYPAAFTSVKNSDGKEFLLKIFKTEIVENNQINTIPGMIRSNHKDVFSIDCIDGSLRILELQLEGKKRMLVDEFLRGFKPFIG